MLPRIMRRFLLRLIFLTIAVTNWRGAAFIYHLNDTFYDASTFTLSERFAYGTDMGPIGFSKGKSYISLSLKIGVEPYDGSAYPASVSTLFYQSDSLVLETPEVNLCSSRPLLPYKATYVEQQSAPIVMLNEVATANVDVYYEVKDSGLIYSLIQVCPGNGNLVIGDYAAVSMDGVAKFHNPYGYLPGLYYGYLPFEACRMVGYVLVALAFSFAMHRHREQVLIHHWGTQVVLLIATVESSSKLAAYMDLNTTGTPYLDYPPLVVFSMAMEVLIRAAVRLLLLLVCLGHGIVREELKKNEKYAVAGLTAAFFVTGILDSMAQTKGAGSLDNQDGLVSVWTLPAFFTDLVFLGWIYTALVSMLQLLEEEKETYKLNMYKRLSWTISTFVCIFACLSVLIVTFEVGNYDWLWEWFWLDSATWEVLNFAVITSICIIWRPTATSGMLSYSKQLATSEEEANAEAEDASVRRTLEMAGLGTSGAVVRPDAFTIGGGADDSGDEEEIHFDSKDLNPFAGGGSDSRSSAAVGQGGRTYADLSPQRDKHSAIV